MSASHPILFSYRDLVAGNGFVAFVATDGRALLSAEDDGFWLYGVTPGGIAGGGKERAQAFREFKISYLSVLYDIASEADSFEAFRASAEQFFAEVNEPNLQEWEIAHAEVTSGTQGPDDLPRVDANTRPNRIEIMQVQQGKVGPNVNEFDAFAEAA